MMTHKVKKAKIKYGRDANRALIRKLVGDFVRYGKLVSTILILFIICIFSLK